MKRLDFKSIHYPVDYLEEIKQCLQNNNFYFPFLDNYGAFADVPFPGLYQEMDKLFPRSKFILTVRDPESWWKSLLWHFNFSREKRLRKYGFYNSFSFLEKIQYNKYPPKSDFLDIKDKDIYIAKFNRHIKEVEKYFKNRSDLLILEISDKKLWQKLCNFLDKPLPSNLSIPWIGKR